jgi:hypothetical protein
MGKLSRISWYFSHISAFTPDCQNPILYCKLTFGNLQIKNETDFYYILAEIRMILNRDIRRKLDERIFEENIGLASLRNLERFFSFYLY